MTIIWKGIVTGQRRRAIMSCFRMLPVYKLPGWVVIGVTPPPATASIPLVAPRCTRYTATVGLNVLHRLLEVIDVFVLCEKIF